MLYLYAFLSIFILVWTIIVGLLLSAIVAMLISKVPYCSTPNEVLDKVVENLDIRPGQVVYDLGCGDGRFLLAVEKKGAKTFGYEISLPSYIRALVNIKKQKSKTKVFFKNFYNADLNDADIVFCFLTGRVMDDVEKLLLKNLKGGTVVVIYENNFADLKPFKEIAGRMQTTGHISKIKKFRRYHNGGIFLDYNVNQLPLNKNNFLWFFAF